ncbi:glyoxylate/hydroxypyruvate reductase A [Gemmobacter aquatilis]|uniref:Glyoxylate/hydroxypyruvate reductase A n=1 Tax=Gemmobacter aquatilis TaxID=933059 RepID=A0A1H8ITF7_9RHOB|nr:glyoxylate/hydroxypyruvate reductase A [Gemmobacter aquatilis]SEN71659.1 glyoxylate/hydroxypyruvate reductase A [Gemmobacter aquatilis]
MTVVLFAAGAALWPEYEAPLRRALAEAGLAVDLVCAAAPEAVDYIIYAPGSPVQDFTPYTRCKAVLNLWAGVERIVGNATLVQPLCRMVDPGLTEGMVEYVVGHVLRHHLGMDRYILGAKGWEQIVPPLARERRVAVLGLGALGLACARALAALNFAVEGWSRSAKPGLGIAAAHGDAGLEAVLRRAEIVVTLLPKTAETENLLDARRLGWLPEGAVIINPGRGALIDDDALLAALEAGRLGHATLDVFRVEPLPEDHPFRAHPRVTVTPHIAADTRASSAARVVVENIRRGEAGLPLLHVVDRARGY